MARQFLFCDIETLTAVDNNQVPGGFSVPKNLLLADKPKRNRPRSKKSKRSKGSRSRSGGSGKKPADSSEGHVVEEEMWCLRGQTKWASPAATNHGSIDSSSSSLGSSLSAPLLHSGGRGRQKHGPTPAGMV
jgi:hypothetical protein